MEKIITDKLKIKDGDYIASDDFAYQISDEDGYLYKEDQMINFDHEGYEVTVYYTLDVDASIKEDSGDYWNPPYTSVDINSVNITLDSVYVDGSYHEINEILKKEIELLIEKTI
jgi:hypothetical protein